MFEPIKPLFFDDIVDSATAGVVASINRALGCISDADPNWHSIVAGGPSTDKLVYGYASGHPQIAFGCGYLDKRGLYRASYAYLRGIQKAQRLIKKEGVFDAGTA